VISYELVPFSYRLAPTDNPLPCRINTDLCEKYRVVVLQAVNLLLAVESDSRSQAEGTRTEWRVNQVLR